MSSAQAYIAEESALTPSTAWKSTSQVSYTRVTPPQCDKLVWLSDVSNGPPTATLLIPEHQGKPDRGKHIQRARAIISWYRREARELPWRGVHATDVSPWAVLVSEFMLQQTQASRVIPQFEAWMERWPTPSALAAEPPGEAVRAWGRLGYPRRALWLHAAAVQIATKHNDRVPSDVEVLLELKGIGPYTARAVASFAYAKREPVVDTNTRRVLARLVHGIAAAAPPRASDLDDMAALLPADPVNAREFNAAAMELGATVCIARSPLCEACPVAAWCEWRGAGFPNNAPKIRRPARFHGSDRQVRGRILALMRRANNSVRVADALAAGAEGGLKDEDQARRAYDSLVTDGLIIEYEGQVRLP